MSSPAPPPRSALPFAAVGIACLGLVPVLGGPDRALHWVMTIGTVGLGALLFFRHRLSRREGALLPVRPEDSRRAGKAVLGVCAISAALVLVIVVSQWRRGGELGLLSLTMPLLGLCWLATLGLQSLWHRNAAAPSAAEALSARRGAQPSALPSASQRPSKPPTDRQVSA